MCMYNLATEPRPRFEKLPPIYDRPNGNPPMEYVEQLSFPPAGLVMARKWYLNVHDLFIICFPHRIPGGIVT